jgi:hypothetical protein
MRYRRLDANGDYVTGTGSDFLVNSPAAVGQAVVTRLRLSVGDWYLDLTEGTPWSTEILGKFTQKTYDAVLKSRILGTSQSGVQLVTQITSYSSSYDPTTCKLSISANIDTIYGSTAISTSL